MNDRITLADFIADAGLVLNVTARGRTKKDGWPVDRWACELKRAGEPGFTFPFHMGTGHNGKAPTIAQVLSALADDAAGVDNASCWQEWADELGYDREDPADDRKAQRAYDLTSIQTENLRGILGEDYETLLWETDRD